MSSLQVIFIISYRSCVLYTSTSRYSFVIKLSVNEEPLQRIFMSSYRSSSNSWVLQELIIVFLNAMDQESRKQDNRSPNRRLFMHNIIYGCNHYRKSIRIRIYLLTGDRPRSCRRTMYNSTSPSCRHTRSYRYIHTYYSNSTCMHKLSSTSTHTITISLSPEQCVRYDVYYHTIITYSNIIQLHHKDQISFWTFWPFWTFSHHLLQTVWKRPKLEMSITDTENVFFWKPSKSENV